MTRNNSEPPSKNVISRALRCGRQCRSRETMEVRRNGIPALQRWNYPSSDNELRQLLVLTDEGFALNLRNAAANAGEDNLTVWLFVLDNEFRRIRLEERSPITPETQPSCREANGNQLRMGFGASLAAVAYCFPAPETDAQPVVAQEKQRGRVLEKGGSSVGRFFGFCLCWHLSRERSTPASLQRTYSILANKAEPRSSPQAS